MSKKNKKQQPIQRNPFATVLAEQTGAGGAGKHQDRRTKRNRTRGAQKRRAIAEWR